MNFSSPWQLLRTFASVLIMTFCSFAGKLTKINPVSVLSAYAERS